MTILFHINTLRNYSNCRLVISLLFCHYYVFISVYVSHRLINVLYNIHVA